jgi:protein TonB
MTHLVVLWLALFAAQAPTSATPPPSQPPTAQPAQSPASTTPTPDQAAPANPPSPNPDASEIYKIGGKGVTPPKVLSQPTPKLSEIAHQQINGIVTLSLIVDKEGNPVNVHVIKSIADTVDKKHRTAALSLDQAAVDFVKQYRFKPAMKDGKPIAVYENIQVNFQIF